VQAKRKELKQPDSLPALAIFDFCKGQTTEAVFKLLEDSNIYVVSIPANRTHRLQPMDLSVNKCIEDFMKKEFTAWYSAKVYEQLDLDEQTPVDLRLSVLKHLSVTWLINTHDYLIANSKIIINGFKASGISDSLIEQYC
jgi:hypothetical protein